MKDRILNIIITVSMVIAANYPMYKSMISTAEEAKIVVDSVKDEFIIWQYELNKMRNNLSDIRNDMINSIDGGIKEAKIAAGKIKALELEIKLLGNKIDSFKENTLDKVKEAIEPKKINNKIDSLKVDTKDKVKKMINFNKLFDIRG
jgi:predicted small metal-binding protein